MILEDGPGVTNPEGEEEDHGEEIMNGLSSQASAIERTIGMAGGLDTVSGAMFE
jgi:hypothetical protein